MIDVKADMELFTYYGYKRLPFPSDYPWYWEALFALEEEEQKENFKNSLIQKLIKYLCQFCITLALLKRISRRLLIFNDGSNYFD